MTQRNSNQSQNLAHSITPGQVVIGAAAAAGAILAGKWLYNNSDKVTLFIDEMTDSLKNEWLDQQGESDLGPIAKHRGPTVGTVSGERTTSKQKIPVH